VLTFVGTGDRGSFQCVLTNGDFLEKKDPPSTGGNNGPRGGGRRAG
jgi:hypothetical protein